MKEKLARQKLPKNYDAAVREVVVWLKDKPQVAPSFLFEMQDGGGNRPDRYRVAAHNYHGAQVADIFRKHRIVGARSFMVAATELFRRAKTIGRSFQAAGQLPGQECVNASQDPVTLMQNIRCYDSVSVWIENVPTKFSEPPDSGVRTLTDIQKDPPRLRALMLKPRKSRTPER